MITISQGGALGDWRNLPTKQRAVRAWPAEIAIDTLISRLLG